MVLPNSKICLSRQIWGIHCPYRVGGEGVSEFLKKSRKNTDFFEGFLINISEGHSSFAQASIESKLLMGSSDMEGGEEGVR